MTVLEAFHPEVRARLEERAVARALVPDDVLYLAGELPERVHVLSAGVLKLVARDPEGEETIVGLAVPGETAGEIAALDLDPQPTDCIAATKVRVMSIEADVFRAAMNEDPRGCAAIARMLASRARWSSEMTIERAAAEVPARLAGRCSN